jgi:hypothetical protein
MRNILLIGTVAGAAAGIAGVISSSIFVNIGLFEPIGGPEIWDTSLMMLFTVAFISLGIIWGMIFGVVFKQFYDRVPGDGMLKGFYFGLLIWIIKDVAAGSFAALINLETELAIGLISVGFFMWIAYGPVLGYLYKKE